MPVARRLVLVLALSLVANEVSADTWLGGAVTNWFSPVAWSDLLGPPTESENAIFARTVFGVTPANTSVSLPGNATIVALAVDIPSSTPYVLMGSNGAVLTATSAMEFQNTDRRASNVTSVSSMRLNTPTVIVRHNAVLSLNNATVTTNSIGTTADGRIDINNGSSVQTLSYVFDQSTGELRVNSGGELSIAGDTTLRRGLTRVNSGGELNAAEGVDLEYNGAARLEFADSHAVDNFVHLKATGGGDISAGEYIDVGNNAIGSLTVDGAGSTLTAQSSTSDWGFGGTGNATVTIANSGLATASQLRAGTNGATFVGNVTSGGTLRTTSTFRMGGGTANRPVSLTVNGGTLETTGLATFDNEASLSLSSGTINFNGGATFNSGSFPIWAGGSMNLGASSTLLIDGTNFIKSSGASVFLTDGVTMRIRNGGSFETETNTFLDLGNATLDMSGGAFRVGLAGGTAVSDWGRNPGTSTTATLTTNARARYESGLRMSQLGGATSVTISSGASLDANGFLTIGGGETSSVTLNVNGGGILRSNGTLSLQRGTTTTVSTAGRVEGQEVVLGSAGATTTTTVTGAGSLLRATGALKAGREGTTLLTVSAGGEARSGVATVLGELAGASSSVTVTGTGSKLTVGGGLTVGDAGVAALQVQNGGLATVTGSVFVNSSSSVFLGDASRLELPAGQSITHEGELEVRGGPNLAAELDADVVNDGGVFRLYEANANRGVTMLADSEMFVDTATVDSLDQIGGSLHFSLRSAVDFDDLFVVDTATFGSNAAFVVSLENGYSPTAGTTFPIFSSGSTITGMPTFDFSAAPLASNQAWIVFAGPQSISAVVAEQISIGTPGDYNENGIVDAADYTVWRDNAGAAAGTLPNDLVGGVIGPAQYTQWAQNYGVAGLMFATAQSTSVPEPASAVMLAIAVAVRVGRRTRISDFA